MIDLHTHTNCSDGTDSPAQLVNKALAEGFSVLAITDHDTTSGWHAAEQALRPNLSLALGAEISCLTTDGISVHMLHNRLMCMHWFPYSVVPLIQSLHKLLQVQQR